jgi:hypothetical protein
MMFLDIPIFLLLLYYIARVEQKTKLVRVQKFGENCSHCWEHSSPLAQRHDRCNEKKFFSLLLSITSEEREPELGAAQRETDHKDAVDFLGQSVAAAGTRALSLTREIFSDLNEIHVNPLICDSFAHNVV